MRIVRLEFGVFRGRPEFSIDRCPEGCAIYTCGLLYLTVLRGECAKPSPFDGVA